MRKTLIATTVAAALALAACGDNTAPAQTATETVAEAATAVEAISSNPLMVKSTLQYEAPNFNDIKDDHFLPAFEEGM